MEERRKYVRIPEDSHISYKCVPQEKGSERMTKNISQGGIRFRVHEFIPKDSHLKIRLNLSRTSVTFEAMVRLVWSRRLPSMNEYEVGVQFIDIPPHAVQHLISYINDFFTK